MWAHSIISTLHIVTTSVEQMWRIGLASSAHVHKSMAAEFSAERTAAVPGKSVSMKIT